MKRNQNIKNFEMTELIPKDRIEEIPPHDCSALQQDAFTQGRLQGIKEGRAQCQVKVDEQLKRAIRLANQVGRARLAALEEQDRDVVEVALTICKRILLKEIDVDKELIVRQVRQILGLLLNKHLVTLKVNPEDLQVLQPLHEALRAEFLDGDHLVLEGHPDVRPGGCLAEQAGLQLDSRLDQQLEAVATEFGLEISSL